MLPGYVISAANDTSNSFVRTLLFDARHSKAMHSAS